MLRRFARRALVVAGMVVLSALLVVVGLLAYLQSASGRRLLAAKVSAGVSRELVGELRIERIDVLASDRLVISNATILDANQRTVISVRGLHLRFDALTLISSAIFEPTIRIELPELRVERVELGLFRTPTGGVSLTDAFASRTPSAPASKPSTGLCIHLPKIAVERFSARTDFNGLDQANAEVRALNADFDYSPELIGFGLKSQDVRVSGALKVAAQARLSVKSRIPGRTEVSLDGNLGALPIHGSFRLSGDQLELDLSSQSLTPEALRALIPAWPLQVPASVRIALSGRVQALHTTIVAQAGGSQLDASGSLALSPSVKGEFSLTGRDLDAQILAPNLAHSALNVQAKLEFALDPTIHVDGSARFAKTDLFGVPLPETTIHVVYDGKQLSGAASAEPGLPVNLDFALSAQSELTFHARVQNLDLVALAPYGLRAQGRFDFDASGELAGDKLVAGFEARVRALWLAPVRAEMTRLRGKIQGSTARMEQLGVELQVDGVKLALGPTEFPAWSLESKGSLQRQLVSLRAGPETEPTLQASTTLGLGQGVSLSDTRLEGAFNGVKHRLELKSARFAERVLELAELRWQIGTGSLTGAARISPTRSRADLELTGLDADAVLKTLGIAPAAFRGRLDARLHFQEDGQKRQGQLQGNLLDGALPELGACQAEFSATIADSRVEGQLTLAVPELGKAKLSGHGVVGPGPITLASVLATSGEMQLDVRDIELQEIARRWLPSASVGLSGIVDGSVRLAKSDPHASASFSYELKTRKLGLHGQGADGEGSLLHAELSSHGQIDTAETSLDFELKDAAGPWLSAQIAQRSGWHELVRVLRSSSPEPLLDAPLRAVISARPRSLELLGSANPLAFSGELAANVDITGTARRPEVAGSLSATGVGLGKDPSGKLELTLDYSAEREHYSFVARYADQQRTKLELDGEGHWGWFETGFGRNWSTRAEGRVERVELAKLGDLLGMRIAGQALGHATVSASASELEATAELSLDELALERHPLGHASVKLRVHQGSAQAQLSIASANAKLDLSGALGLRWDGGPSIDPKRGGSLELRVRNYQLAALAPLLRSAASDIRGPLNGFVVLAWEPADKAGKRKTRLRADANLSGGSVTLASGAGSLQCTELRALAANSDVLNLKLTGCSHSNKPNLEASADVRFNGPAPERVDATFRLAKVPLSYEGVVLGTATVDPKARPISLSLNLTGAQRGVDLNIPALEFELPTKDDTRLVDLEEDPAIVVTDAKVPDESTGESEETSQWSVSVRLGKSVSVKQPGMRVPITGTLSQGPDGLLNGSIVFPEGGVVPQLGQLFRLKRGSVRFDHQAIKEGVLSIEASTRTADGVVVDLYVSGTLGNPVIRFQSDPPRSESDIVALLLGLQGSDAPPSTGQKGQDPRGSATALAMNQLLRGSALGGVQFGAGQTSKGDSVSTVSVRAMDKVWLEGRTVRSTSQRAANSGAQSSGVVDWRFARGFSLRTQLGNISGVELRWSHRY